MQPILAESVPHPRRNIALAAAIAVIASLAFAGASSGHRADHRDHVRLQKLGKCSHTHGYTLIAR